jgi:hypothetical protein
MASTRVTFRVTVRSAGSPDATPTAAAGPSSSPPPPSSSYLVLSGDAPELGDFDPARAVRLARADPLDGAQTPGTEVWSTPKPVVFPARDVVHYA